MKKIIIALDSFKGSISSADAARAVSDGLLSVLGDSAVTLEIPIADGGEGTLRRLVRGDCLIEIDSVLTDGRPGRAVYGYTGGSSDGPRGYTSAGIPEHNILDFSGAVAVIEMARVAGLTLVPDAERNPMSATTYGVGVLINDALARGFRRFIITIGGSGTNDGGAGMLCALGAVLLDNNRNPLTGCGGNLSKIADINITNLNKLLFNCEISLACDVINPLLGPNGATYTYGRQKGADERMLAELEAGMANYSRIVERLCGFPVSSVPGSGAGGGIGVPLLAFYRARVESGITAVLNASEYYDHLLSCDLVITGEGMVDSQTLCGKAVCGVADPAIRVGIPVVVFAGCAGEGADSLLDTGISRIYTLVDLGVDTEYSIAHSRELLFRLAANFAKEYFL